MAGHRGQIDDGPTAFLQVGDAGERTVVHPLYIDGVESVQVGLGGLFEVADETDAGIVDQDVDGAQFGDRVDHLPHPGLITDVAVMVMRTGVFRQVEYVHGGAALPQFVNDRRADAARPTGYDGCPVG